MQTLRESEQSKTVKNHQFLETALRVLTSYSFTSAVNRHFQEGFKNGKYKFWYFHSENHTFIKVIGKYMGYLVIESFVNLRSH